MLRLYTCLTQCHTSFQIRLSSTWRASLFAIIQNPCRTNACIWLDFCLPLHTGCLHNVQWSHHCSWCLPPAKLAVNLSKIGHQIKCGPILGPQLASHVFVELSKVDLSIIASEHHLVRVILSLVIWIRHLLSNQVLDCFLRKSKERVGVDTSSLFTRFGGRPLEHNSSKTDNNKGDKQVQVMESWERQQWKLLGVESITSGQSTRPSVFVSLQVFRRELSKRQDKATFSRGNHLWLVKPTTQIPRIH